MAFQFSLAALLKLRDSLEKQARSNLERAVSAHSAQQERIDFAQDIAAQSRKAVRAEIDVGLPAAELHWHNSRRRASEKALMNAKQVLKEMSAVRATQTEHYLTAHRESEVLNHMRSKKLEEYARGLSRREQEVLDWLHLAKIVRERRKR